MSSNAKNLKPNYTGFSNIPFTENPGLGLGSSSAIYFNTKDALECLTTK